MEEPIQYTEDVLRVVTDTIKQFFSSRNNLAQLVKIEKLPDNAKAIYDNTLKLTDIIDDLTKLPDQKEDFVKAFVPFVKKTRNDLKLVANRIAESSEPIANDKRRETFCELLTSGARPTGEPEACEERSEHANDDVF